MVVAACVALSFFFSFLTYSPFCSPNISFYPFTPFNGTGTTKFGTKSFLYFFGFHLKALSYELLVIQSLDLHINYGFEWHLFDSPMAFPCPYFLSPFSIPPCLFVVSQYLYCVCLFLRFCVSVQMYELCPSAVWPCRCGREPANETSRSFSFQP